MTSALRITTWALSLIILSSLGLETGLLAMVLRAKKPNGHETTKMLNNKSKADTTNGGQTVLLLDET